MSLPLNTRKEPVYLKEIEEQIWRSEQDRSGGDFVRASLSLLLYFHLTYFQALDDGTNAN